jgi:hypothetical protein
MDMLIPEWEMEEIIASNPALLSDGIDGEVPIILAQQHYLAGCGGFVDLLVTTSTVIWIVELKNEFVEDVTVITDQLHKYLCELEMVSYEGKKSIRGLLVSTHGFSQEVIDAATAKHIHLLVLRSSDLLATISSTSISVNDLKRVTARILQRRSHIGSLAEAMVLISESSSETRPFVYSSEIFIRDGKHDEHALAQIALLFRMISAKAPLMAHEVGSGKVTNHLTEDDLWFWFFYSVLDRRANASTFVTARSILEANDLFGPQAIVDFVLSSSKEKVVRAIRDILASNSFPLCSDSVKGDLAMPTSIVDAAIYLGHFGYSVENWVRHFTNTKNMPAEYTNAMMRDLIASIYGVGPRIAAQIVRGLALKRGYDIDLSSPVQLERCRFNEFFAGPLRFGLVPDQEDYQIKLQEFAKQHPVINCGIISHVLWFIRKRFCSAQQLCDECPMAGFCMHFRRRILSRSNAGNDVGQLRLF